MENTRGKMKKFCKLCNRNLIDIKERYCNSCKAKIGIRHSIYKKDRKDTKEQKFYSSKEWLRVRDIIRGLDNNLCLMCLDKNELNNSGTIHHIEELKDNWSKRFDKDNLISLCESCHQKVHRKYLSNKEEIQHELRVLIKKYREQREKEDDYMPLIMGGVAVWLIGCMGIAHYAAKVMCS